jgi:hypothetical protein
MSQTNAQTRVLQAIQDGELSPYGSAKVQMQDTTAYVAVPIELVNALGIQQGMEVQRGYHSGTGSLVVFLSDTSEQIY